MSAQVVQRIVARMLLDPSLHQRVCADDQAALQGLAVSSEERVWLKAIDPRALSADRMRQRRMLKGLLEEYRASSALAAGGIRKMAVLDAFFRSSFMHDCVQHRGSLAHAFGEYLISFVGDDRMAAVAKVEQAKARARRSVTTTISQKTFSDAASYVRSPHVVPLMIPDGTMAVMQAVEQVLFEISLAPVMALVDDGPTLANIPALKNETQIGILVERQVSGEVTLSDSAEGLVRLLQFADSPKTGNALIECAQKLGADVGEERSVIEPLIMDGLLLRV